MFGMSVTYKLRLGRDPPRSPSIRGASPGLKGDVVGEADQMVVRLR